MFKPKNKYFEVLKKIDYLTGSNSMLSLVKGKAKEMSGNSKVTTEGRKTAISKMYTSESHDDVWLLGIREGERWLSSRELVDY